MSTTGDAPLNLTLPQSADFIDLGVLNANYVSINALAADHETRLDAVEPLVTSQGVTIASQGTTIASGAVYNSIRWNGKQVFVSSTAPTTGMVAGDIWLKVQ